MTDLLETNERSEAKHEQPVLKKRVEMMQVGVDSFAAALLDDGKDVAVSTSDSVRNLVKRIELADQVGLDVFGGEHGALLVGNSGEVAGKILRHSMIRNLKPKN